MSEAIASVKPVKPKVKRPIRHLNTAQRAEACALWRAGTHTVDELAKKFKKDRSTMLRIFKEDGAEKNADGAETTRKVQEAVQEAIVSDVVVLANRIRETKEDHYKMASNLAKLVWSTVLRAKQEGKPLGTTLPEVKALQTALSALKTAREERYAVLGISATDDHEDKPMPDLVVQELTASDIAEMHKQKMVSNEDLGSIELEELGDEDVITDEDERVEVGEDD